MNDALIDTVLAGRYRILFPIAKGGMGAVYEAEDERSRRRVAVKVIRDEFLRDVVSIERFRREATVSASIRHPSIVATLEASLDSSPAYFVMELLDGPTIAELLQHADRLPWQRSARIALDVLEGLGALHAAGAIHRDIKPSNVMVVRDGGGERAKLIDLGVIRVAPETGDESLTWSGNVVGTPAFMAPEQYAGEAIDARADLYAAGVLLAKMLLGAHAVLRVPLARGAAVEGWPADVPAACARLCEALLRQAPDDRPPSADAAARALADILSAHAARDKQPSAARPTESSYAGPQTTNHPRVQNSSAVEIHGPTPPSSMPSLPAPPPSSGSLAARSIAVATDRSVVRQRVAAVVAAVTAASVVAWTAARLATRDEAPATETPAPLDIAQIRAQIAAPNVSVVQAGAQTRFIPMGTRLVLSYGVPDAANMRTAMTSSVETPMRACIDPATHPLGQQVVNAMIDVDERGAIARLDTTANQTTPDEEACAVRVLRGARWPVRSSAYSVQLIAYTGL